MFNLLPWRWTHWVLLLIGPLFVIVYLTLLAWVPVDEAIQRLASRPETRVARHPAIARAEAIFSLTTLVLLTPLAGVVALFLVLFAMIALTVILGPFVRVIGLPDWVVVLLLGAALSAWLYTKTAAWLPWSLWLLDRVATVYIVLFL